MEPLKRKTLFSIFDAFFSSVWLIKKKRVIFAGCISFEKYTQFYEIQTFIGRIVAVPFGCKLQEQAHGSRCRTIRHTSRMDCGQS